MNPESQGEQIINSLKAITEIFRSCNANYRVLGSTLLVAYTNRVFRHINDVDVLFDIRARDCVFEKLKNYGFELERKAKAGFPWFEAKKMDKQVLGEEMSKTRVKTYNNISVYVFGLKLPYLYDLFSFFYNICGGIRVMFGRKYEIWD